MTNVWTALAALIEAIANMGAGAASTGIGYEPDVPNEIRK